MKYLKLSSDVVFRKLQCTDYEKYVCLLSQLTTVGSITKNMFKNRVKEIDNNENLHIFVICNTINGDLIAAGTIYIEPKVILGCYKITLACSENNVRFYEKCKFINEGREMVCRL
jgi:hypothetical protein